MGKRYAQPGEQQARAVLHDLATSPATAHHIATKLARHFVADDPPPALVDRLASPPLVSVIVPAFNEELTIVESVRALLALEYESREIVVVNDGSTDGTLSVLQRAFELVPAPHDGDGAIVDAARDLGDAGERVLIVTADRGLRARLGDEVMVAGPGWLNDLIGR